MELNDEEIICDRCNGTGRDNPNETISKVCKKCLGFKKLTWTERILGRKDATGYIYAPYVPSIVFDGNDLITIDTKEKLKE